MLKTEESHTEESKPKKARLDEEPEAELRFEAPIHKINEGIVALR